MLGRAEPSFTYSGRVVDEQNNLIAGATVSFGLPFHPETATFEDDHSFPDATTDAQGNYSTKLATPWVRGFAVEPKGYARFDRWTEGVLLASAPASTISLFVVNNRPACRASSVCL
jgi:hypothetical protein